MDIKHLEEKGTCRNVFVCVQRQVSARFLRRRNSEANTNCWGHHTAHNIVEGRFLRAAPCIDQKNQFYTCANEQQNFSNQRRPRQRTQLTKLNTCLVFLVFASGIQRQALGDLGLLLFRPCSFNGDHGGQGSIESRHVKNFIKKSLWSQITNGTYDTPSRSSGKKISLRINAIWRGKHENEMKTVSGGRFINVSSKAGGETKRKTCEQKNNKHFSFKIWWETESLGVSKSTFQVRGHFRRVNRNPTGLKSLLDAP